MSKFRFLMKLTALLALLCGCSKPPPPKVADLSFPVAVLYPSASSVLYNDAADLGVMHVNHLLNLEAAPVLVDSDFKIYTLEKLRSTHGGLWLMAHPSGSTEVAFDLVSAPKSGLEGAREAIRAQLDKQNWRTDLEKKRKALTAQNSLKAMLDILQETER